MVDIQISSNANQLARKAAESFLEVGNQAIRENGRFSVALSGGSTPKAAYQLLRSPEFSAKIEWSSVHIFWGDERCVPPDHPDSNYRMTKATLLDHVPIPETNIHRMRGELEPQEAAAANEKDLKQFFGDSPHFDLILLGMGIDGHTASLFPGTAAIHEENRWAAAHYVDKLSSWRITLTPAIINRAKSIIFLISGESKAQPLQRVLHGRFQPNLLPSQIIAPNNGTLTWLIDEAAASLLET
jgi:6-phosphogluconolactonase